jgi:hypothetical protein
MKLAANLATRAARQFDAWAVPPTHAMAHSFARVFGDHTFFIDRHGLSIVEVLDDAEAVPVEHGRVVKIATWADAACTALSPHPRETTPVKVRLDEPN